MNDEAFVPALLPLAECSPADTSPVRLLELPFTSREDLWTREEKASLTELFYNDEALVAIAERLGRPLQGIRSMVHLMGLRRNSTRPWTEDEEAALLLRYGKEPAASLASELGRAPSAVYARANALGLSQLVVPPWSVWEIAQLRQGMEAGTPLAEIAEGLGRTPNAAQAKARELGFVSALRKTPWTEAEDAQLRQHGLLMTARSLSLHLAAIGLTPRSRQAVKNRLKQLGVSRDRVNLWTEEEDDVLRAAARTGASQSEIAASLGRTLSTLRHRWNFLGLRHSNPKGACRGDPWTTEQHVLLRSGYATGMRAKDIARATGKSLDAVYAEAQHLGLKSSRWRTWGEHDDKLLRKCVAKGLSGREASKELGRTYDSVMRRAAQIGLRFPKAMPFLQRSIQPEDV